MGEFFFDVCLGVRGQDAKLNRIGQQRCPACDSLMIFHQPDEASPHRLLAHCDCEECGIWFAVVVRPDEQVVYLIRLPSVIELVEAIARRGPGDAGPFSHDGQ